MALTLGFVDFRYCVAAMTESKITLSNRAVPLRVRRHRRARRMVLRIDRARDEAVLTLPWRVSLKEGLAFAEERRDWLSQRLAELPARVPFAPGATIPLRGEPHRVMAGDGSPRRSGVVWVEAGEIYVTGNPEHVARRLADWFKAEAKRALEPLARAKAARLGYAIRRVTVRDTRTLWGSCSAAGDLSLCWRLTLAPPHVADYVCAHEVAHLAFRGHGPRFWRLVAELADDMEGARAWLAREGESLQRYGLAAFGRDGYGRKSKPESKQGGTSWRGRWKSVWRTRD